MTLFARVECLGWVVRLGANYDPSSLSTLARAISRPNPPFCAQQRMSITDRRHPSEIQSQADKDMPNDRNLSPVEVSLNLGGHRSLTISTYRFAVDFSHARGLTFFVNR
jgi:hypothetical protein